MRHAIVIALWIIGIVSGGIATFGVMGNYGFMPLVCVIAALGVAGLVGFCALLCNYPAVRYDASITALWVAGIALIIAIIAYLINHHGFVSVAKVIGVIVWVVLMVVWVIAVVPLIFKSIPKVATSVISFLKALNPKHTASIIASVAALIFAIAIAAIVVAVIIKIF